MNYKDIAIINERKLKANTERLKTLLYNTITALEEEQVFDTHAHLLDYLGMTEKEYNEIMGE